MGTNGTIAVKFGAVEVRTYNHFDSYPTGLGVDFAQFIREADPRVISAQLALVKMVDENDTAPEEVIEEMRAQGIYQNVSQGNDWYAALRGIQGNISEYLRVGYLPAWTWGDNQEWGYLADFDARTLAVSYNGKVIRTLDFDALTDDESIASIMKETEAIAYA